MANWIECTDAATQQKILVNMDLATAIKPEGAGASIFFGLGTESPVSVTETPVALLLLQKGQVVNPARKWR